MYSLFGIVFRILGGERLRKASPREAQLFSAVFALTGLYFGLIFALMRYRKHLFDFMDADGPLALTVIWTLVIAALSFLGWFWGMHVPAKVSYTLAAILWPLLFILALTGHVGP